MYRWFKLEGKWRIGAIEVPMVQLFDPQESYLLEDLEIGPFIFEPLPRQAQVTELVPIESENTLEDDVLDDPGDLFVHDYATGHKSERQYDCGVVCVANILQIVYGDARLKAFRAGWSSTVGMKAGAIEAMIKRDGLGLRFVKEICGMTPKEASKILPEKSTVIVYQREHVAAIVNRVILNADKDVIKDAYYLVESN